MDERILTILSGLHQDEHGIWCAPVKAAEQKEELILRQAVASHQTDNILSTISFHHSIEVMDHEIRRALTLYAHNQSIIVDVGGCLGLSLAQARSTATGYQCSDR